MTDSGKLGPNLPENPNHEKQTQEVQGIINEISSQLHELFTEIKIPPKQDGTQERRNFEIREKFEDFIEHFKGKIWNRHDEFMESFVEFFDEKFEGIEVKVYTIHHESGLGEYICVDKKKVFLFPDICDDLPGEFVNEKKAFVKGGFAEGISGKGGGGAIRIDYPWGKEKAIVSFGNKDTPEKIIENIKKLTEQEFFKVFLESELKPFVLAYIDEKTNLYNSFYAKSRFNDSPSDVFYIDIDNFKQINDTLGHDKGDECIIHIAQILQDFCNSPYIKTRMIPAHLHGDEFIILADVEDKSAANDIIHLLSAEFFNNSFIQDLNAGFEENPIGLSIGYTKYEDGTSFRSTLKKADAAMFTYKKQKKKNPPK